MDQRTPWFGPDCNATYPAQLSLLGGVFRFAPGCAFFINYSQPIFLTRVLDFPARIAVLPVFLLQPWIDYGMPFRCAKGLPFSENEEPTLDELLAEPIIRLVMKRDDVEEVYVRQLAAQVRERLKSLNANRSERSGPLW